MVIVGDLEERAGFVRPVPLSGTPVPPQPYDSHRVADEESIAHYCKFTFDGFSKDSPHQGQEKQSYYRKNSK